MREEAGEQNGQEKINQEENGMERAVRAWMHKNAQRNVKAFLLWMTHAMTASLRCHVKHKIIIW